MDLEHLRQRTFGTASEVALRLSRVDLIPLRTAPDTAILGLWFDGGPCTVGQYLGWVSRRNFGDVELHNQQGTGATIRVGGLHQEILASLQEGREPRPERMASARTLDPNSC